MQIGAQLYTVHDFLKTPEDFAETLKKIAEIGYRTVQVSGAPPYDAGWLAENLQKNGLTCVLTHIVPDRILHETDTVATEHKRFGCRYVGIGSAPGGLQNGMADYLRFREDFLPAIHRLNELGLRFGYHNHYMEFQRYDGVSFMERLEKDFTPEELFFILDTYWVQYSGADPAAWIRRLAGRVPCVHLKDMAIVSNAQRMAPVGEGNLNFEAILDACDTSGVEYLLVEQDNCNGEDPFDCLRRSYQNLKAMGLE